MIYRGVLFLIERRFEVFMNVVLFKQIIQNAITGDISEEMILCLIRAGMVLMNVQVWKTFVSSRDSGNINRTTKGIVLKTTLNKAKKSTRTTTTKNSKKGSRESEIVKKNTSQPKVGKALDATQLSEGKTILTDKTHATDSIDTK